MRRSMTLVALTCALVVGAALPAVAQPLEEWLDRAAAADFTGRQVTVCDTPDGRVSEVIDVSQMDGVLVIHSQTGEIVIRAGAVMRLGRDGSGSVSSVESASRGRLADRYASVVRGASEVISRPVTLVEVREGELVRVRYAFDDATGAVLQSDVHDGDGTPYCTSQFVKFSPDAVIDLDEPGDVREVLLAALRTEVSLPTQVAGFVRRDVYQGPHASTAAFYSDGIFSFTVVVADRKINVPDLDDAPLVEVGGKRYQRRFTPGQVVYSWESADGGLVLIGDLPPDLQAAALAELPEPGAANFLVRIWRRIFR